MVKDWWAGVVGILYSLIILGVIGWFAGYVQPPLWEFVSRNLGVDIGLAVYSVNYSFDIILPVAFTYFFVVALHSIGFKFRRKASAFYLLGFLIGYFSTFIGTGLVASYVLFAIGDPSFWLVSLSSIVSFFCLSVGDDNQKIAEMG